MFRKVLIANRGEIAVRVIRACRELGISTVAVFTQADADALHVRLADEAYPLDNGHGLRGRRPDDAGARVGRGYLDIPTIIEIATGAGCDAIHPGYGFLSENPRFAAICETWGISFIGPSADAIEKAGVKGEARKRMQKAGVPVVPGSEGTVEDDDVALEVAAAVGYPVLVKASGGGGGRGIRIVQRPEELPAALARIREEARGAFGMPEVYIEKYLERPRHIEVQVLADHHGTVVHVGERESSIQRRRQKILEEAPSVAVDPELREAITAAAIRAALAVGYTNAGTVECLLDPASREFYFMEMNARIQVEHPVTEMVYGVDLIKEQIRIAAGLPLSFSQADVVPRGWAIECRINAEDPDRGLLPSPGRITAYHEPGGPGVRVDSGVTAGDDIPPFFDSMFAKCIVWGRDRPEAISRMRRALGEFHIEGVKTTIPLHLRLLEHPDFVAGNVDTGFLEREFLAVRR